VTVTLKLGQCSIPPPCVPHLFPFPGVGCGTTCVACVVLAGLFLVLQTSVFLPKFPPKPTQTTHQAMVHSASALTVVYGSTFKSLNG
jgi:hypothetical protein